MLVFLILLLALAGFFGARMFAGAQGSVDQGSGDQAVGVTAVATAVED